jgi:hypothetical protein
MSKGYTISFFINVLKNTTTRAVSKNGVYNVVAPRFGDFSVKASALDSWLGYKTSAIEAGEGKFASYGKTPRARLLTALRNRKVNGTV